jgi:hypothetical protein
LERITFLGRTEARTNSKALNAETQRRREKQRKAEEEKEKPGGLGNWPPDFF